MSYLWHLDGLSMALGIGELDGYEILVHGDLNTRFFSHEIFWTRIARITRMFFCTLEHEIFLNTNNPNDTNIFFSTRISPITRMLVRVGTLTWRLLNENDTNEINTDSIQGFVNPHCLCLVLKIESLYSFFPTIGKKAFIVLTYRKGARSSLLYIIQCFKISSEVTSF